MALRNENVSASSFGVLRKARPRAFPAQRKRGKLWS